MKKIVFVILLFVLSLKLFSQPGPGDIFREYIWITPDYKNSEKFLRVGGRFDYRNEPEKFPQGYVKEGYITLPFDVDLKKAVKAEIQVEKDLCHEGTRGLAIKIRDGEWHTFPESDNIPYPQWNYLHHTYPVVQIPLDELEADRIQFKLRVDSVQEWNWPQNLIYSVIFRVYYERDKTDIMPELKNPVLALDNNNEIHLGLQSAPGNNVRSVTYIGNYTDVNYEGDGAYDQWHYNYYRGMRENHLGRSNSAPFDTIWNTEWVPDQQDPIEIAALIELKNGLKYFTPSRSTTLPDRPEHSVILCKPEDQPEKWTTRAGEFTSSFNLPADPEIVIEYQLVWASWSPCYANGIYINEHLLYIREDPCYDFKFHRVILEDTRPLKKGRNILKTGQTPRDRDGDMVHGMDVQWPGIMLLVKLKK